MPLLEKFTDFLVGAKTAIATVVSNARALDKERDDLAAERSRLIGGERPTKQEVLRQLDVYIKEQRGRWAHHNAPRLVAALSGRISVTPGDQIGGVTYDENLTQVIGQLEFPALCALVPDLVRAGLAKMIDDPKLVAEDGPSLLQRIDLIAKLDEKIRELEIQHAELVDAARASGVPLEHWPNETARRARAADAHAAWERDARANAALYRHHPEMKRPEPPQA